MRTTLLAALAALLLLAAGAPPALAAQAPGQVTFALPGAEKPVNGSAPGSGVSAVAARADGGADIAGLAPGRKLVLARLTKTGALDTTFGKGGFAQPALPDGLNPVQLLRQADGRLILVAQGPAENKYQLPNFALARLNDDGTLDTSFGSGGVAVLHNVQVGCADCAVAALTSTGQIVLAAATGSIDPAIERDPNAPRNFRFVVARLTSAGALDATFGTGGLATLPGNGVAYGVAIQPTGAIAAFGVSGTTIANQTAQLVRLTPLGTVDPTFNGGSPVAPPFKYPRRILAQPDGGTLLLGLDGAQAKVARYTPLGALDPGYGTGGVTALDQKAVGASPGLLADGGGQALVIGSKFPTAASPAIVRLTAAGQPDPALGGWSGRHAFPRFGGGNLNNRGIGPLVQDSFTTSGEAMVARRADGGLLVIGNLSLLTSTGEGEGRFIDQAGAFALTPGLDLDPSFGGARLITLAARVPSQRVRVKRTRSKAYVNLTGIQVRLNASGPGLATVNVRHGKTLLASGTVAVYETGRQNVKVLLTTTGRRLLAHPRRWRVTVSARLRDLLAGTARGTGKGSIS